LDKNSSSLLYHLSDYEDKFKSFPFIKHRKRPPKYYVCPDHNDDPNFVWCTCNKSRFKEGQKVSDTTQVLCNKCKRWFHEDCSGLKDLREDFDCKGCVENDFFIKSVQLPELIERVGEIETKTKLDRNSIKILDSFIFRLSEALLRIILDKKNTFEV
jgi:hypothetical protein